MVKYTLLLLILACSACKRKDVLTNSNQLTFSGNILALPIGDDVNPVCKRVSFFEIGEEEFLSYVNYPNHLLIFSIKERSLRHEVRFDSHGPNAVGVVAGLHFNCFDSIFILTNHPDEIVIANIGGRVIDRVGLSNLNNGGIPPVLYRTIHQLNNPVIYKNSKLHFSIYYPHFPYENPISLGIKYCLENRQLELSPLTIPESHIIRDGSDFHYSRVFDGKRWVYAFLLTNQLYALSCDNNYEVFAGRSMHASVKIKGPDVNSNSLADALTERYLSVIHDPWRDVFYRIFLPEEKGRNGMTGEAIMNLIENPRVFSVLVLDENLNVIGETLMPENYYHPEMFFVNSDGLYFALHFNHPDFEMNYLKFAEFKVKNQQNNPANKD